VQRRRPIETVEITGGLEGADDEGSIRVGRSFGQQRSARTDERVHLAVTSYTQTLLTTDSFNALIIVCPM